MESFLHSGIENCPQEDDCAGLLEIERDVCSVVDHSRVALRQSEMRSCPGMPGNPHESNESGFLHSAGFHTARAHVCGVGCSLLHREVAL